METIRFLPDRLNAEPTVFRGFTTPELGLTRTERCLSRSSLDTATDTAVRLGDYSHRCPAHSTASGLDRRRVDHPAETGQTG